MHRELLKNALISYSPSDAGEVRCKEQMLSFLFSHVDCFERTLAVGHFTGSAWLLSRDESKALLMHHAKLDLWVQVGGHCDGDPDVLSVACKEAKEESGLHEIVPVSCEIFDLDIHLIPESHKEKAHLHYDVRFLLQAKNDTVLKNQESKELRWIDKNGSNLPTSDPSIMRMFQKWRDRESSC